MDMTELVSSITERIHNFDLIFPSESNVLNSIADEAIRAYSEYKPHIDNTTITYEDGKEEYLLPTSYRTIFDLYYESDNREYPDFTIYNQTIRITSNIDDGEELIVKFFTTHDETTIQNAENALKEYIFYEYLSDNAAQAPNFSFGDSDSDNYKRYKALSDKAKRHEEKFYDIIEDNIKGNSYSVNQDITSDNDLVDAIQDDGLGF
jgi:hypothetical protein